MLLDILSNKELGSVNHSQTGFSKEDLISKKMFSFRGIPGFSLMYFHCNDYTVGRFIELIRLPNKYTIVINSKIITDLSTDLKPGDAVCAVGPIRGH